MAKYCKWFKEVTYADESLVGKKAAILADLHKAKFPVPNGFVITSEAYKDFIKARDLDSKILAKLKTITDENLVKVSQEIQNFFLFSSLSADLLNEVDEFYSYIDVAEELRNAPISAFISSGRDSAIVAMRSSAINSAFSYAVLNLTSSQKVTRGVLEFWASLFSPEAIKYRNDNNISYEDIDIALIVQRQVNAEKSGIAYLKDDSTIALEAIWGMGMSFAVRNFRASKDLFGNKIVKKNIPKENKEGELLTDRELKVLSELLLSVNEHLYHQQDIEWGMEKNRLFLLQSTKKVVSAPAMPKLPEEQNVKPSSQPQPEAPEEENRPQPQEPAPVDKLEPYELLRLL